MFRLCDHTRQRICLAAFFALCIAPTAVVAVWCITRQLPGHLRAETQRLSQELGMDVAIEKIRHLRPGVVLYEGLQLSDPETLQSALRCRTLEATWTELVDTEGDRRPVVVLTASHVEIETAVSDRLWQLLQRNLQGQNGRPETELRVTVDQLALRTGETSQMLADLEGGIGMLPGGIQAQAAFRLAVAASPDPVRVRIVRNRQIAPPASGFELDTGGNELPCPMLAIGLAELNSLGPASRFAGYVWANQASTGWEGEMTGKWLGIDLDGLVSGRFPHKFSGAANVAIRVARFRQGRLEEAAGELTAGPGVIGRSLVDAAATHLRLTGLPQQTSARDVLPYDRLAMGFSIDARGLLLQGRCTDVESGTVLAIGGSRLLGEPAAQPQPVVALIRTLVPASDIQVPATPQTDWLTRHLPVPDALVTRPSRPTALPATKPTVERTLEK